MWRMKSAQQIVAALRSHIKSYINSSGYTAHTVTQEKQITCEECTQVGAADIKCHRCFWQAWKVCKNYWFTAFGQSFVSYCVYCVCQLLLQVACTLIVSMKSFPSLFWPLKSHFNLLLLFLHHMQRLNALMTLVTTE